MSISTAGCCFIRRIFAVKKRCVPIKSLTRHSRDSISIEHEITQLDLLLGIALLKLCSIHGTNPISQEWWHNILACLARDIPVDPFSRFCSLTSFSVVNLARKQPRPQKKFKSLHKCVITLCGYSQGALLTFATTPIRHFTSNEYSIFERNGCNHIRRGAGEAGEEAGQVQQLTLWD